MTNVVTRSILKKAAVAVLATCLFQSVQGQGTVVFANHITGAVDAPFFDDKGSLLSGGSFLAQLFAGRDPDRLVAVGEATAFRSGTDAGYVNGGAVEIPWSVLQACGGQAWVQIRAWEAVGGGRFEEAARSGYWTGISRLLYQSTCCPHLGGVPCVPVPLVGLEYPGAPIIVSNPQNTKARLGESVSLSLVASGGISIFYQWFVGQQGDTNLPITGATNTVLITPPLTGDRSFWVRAQTEAGTIDSAAALVDVYPPESILLELSLSNTWSRFVLHAPPGGMYQLQSSTNLAIGSWGAVTNLVIPSSPFEYIEHTDTNASSRFYRVMSVKGNGDPGDSVGQRLRARTWDH